jgi:hypothetical protein
LLQIELHSGCNAIIWYRSISMVIILLDAGISGCRVCDGFIDRVYSGCVGKFKPTNSTQTCLWLCYPNSNVSCQGRVQTLKLAECLNVEYRKLSRVYRQCVKVNSKSQRLVQLSKSENNQFHSRLETDTVEVF